MKITIHGLPVLLAFVAVAAVALADEPAPEPLDHLVEFTIEDQFENEHTQDEFAGKTMVLFWGDREGSEHIERWEKTVRRKLKRELADGSVEVRVVAHVQGVPGMIKGMVRGHFSKEPEEWTLMDWEGVFAAAYAPVEKHCNIMVFGRDGAHLYQQASNKLEQPVLDGVLAAVKQSLEDEGAPGQTSAPSGSPAD